VDLIHALSDVGGKLFEKATEQQIKYIRLLYRELDKKPDIDLNRLSKKGLASFISIFMLFFPYFSYIQR